MDEHTLEETQGTCTDSSAASRILQGTTFGHLLSTHLTLRIWPNTRRIVQQTKGTHRLMARACSMLSLWLGLESLPIERNVDNFSRTSVLVFKFSTSIILFQQSAAPRNFLLPVLPAFECLSRPQLPAR